MAKYRSPQPSQQLSPTLATPSPFLTNKTWHVTTFLTSRFFHRIAAKRPIPVPGTGLQVTQLGHVKDLSDAFVKVLGNTKAANEIYNISGERFVTFDGIARACAIAGEGPPAAVSSSLCLFPSVSLLFALSPRPIPCPASGSEVLQVNRCIY
jgi:nucleoside-diphosphate-sugar epimerase